MTVVSPVSFLPSPVSNSDVSAPGESNGEFAAELNRTNERVRNDELADQSASDISSRGTSGESGDSEASVAGSSAARGAQSTDGLTEGPDEDSVEQADSLEDSSERHLLLASDSAITANEVNSSQETPVDGSLTGDSGIADIPAVAAQTTVAAGHVPTATESVRSPQDVNALGTKLATDSSGGVVGQNPGVPAAPTTSQSANQPATQPTTQPTIPAGSTASSAPAGAESNGASAGVESAVANQRSAAAQPPAATTTAASSSVDLPGLAGQVAGQGGAPSSSQSAAQSSVSPPVLPGAPVSGPVGTPSGGAAATATPAGIQSTEGAAGPSAAGGASSSSTTSAEASPALTPEASSERAPGERHGNVRGASEPDPRIAGESRGTGAPGGAQTVGAPGLAGVASPVLPAQMQSATPLIDPRGSEQPVAQQLAAHVSAFRGRSDGSYETTLNLRPADLGSVTVKLQVSGGAVSLQAFGMSAVAVDVLREAMPELREDLLQSGLDLVDSQVDRDPSSFGDDEREVTREVGVDSVDRGPTEPSTGRFGSAGDPTVGDGVISGGRVDVRV